MIDLLKKNGNFYKANIHCHTVLSDGKMTPEQVKDYYKKHGYSIIAYTDHNKYFHHKNLNDKDFLTIGGFEADFHVYDKSGTPTRLRTCHLNFYAKNPETAVMIPEPKVYNVTVINDYIKKMAENGWLCTLNHPAWSLQPTDEVVAIDHITAMEVYNHGCQTIYNCGNTINYYFSYLASGKKTFAVATDDNHCALLEDGLPDDYNDVCGGYIEVSMPELTYENFIDAFENGRFYASTGVDLKELYIDEQTDELVISCSPVCRIVTRGIKYYNRPRIGSRNNDITHARIPMSEIKKMHPTYFRVELFTTDGKCAYSQPYYFDEK